jgi:hypothetical protein
MLKEMIEALLERGSEKVTIHEIGDKTYANHRLYQIEPDALPMVGPIQVCTLSAVVDYLVSADESRAEATGPLLLHVASNLEVRVMTQAFGPLRQRECLLEAAHRGSTFPYGSYLSQEEAMIKVQAAFVADKSRQQLLDFIGRLVAMNSVEGTDTGAAQSVVVKKGVGSFAKEGATVPNPITLRPSLTFAEVEQPARDFVVRIGESDKGVPKIALFATDGDLWILEAIGNIKSFIENELDGHRGDHQVIILA